MIDVPRAFRDTPHAAKALRLKALLLVICGGWAAFAAQHLITGMYRIAVVDIVGLALTLATSAWATRKPSPGRLDKAGHLAMVISIGTIIAVCLYSGQRSAMASWYLTAVPLFIAYAIGTRAARYWTLVAVVALVAIHYSPYLIVVEPDYVPNEETWFKGRLILLGILYGLGVASRRATDANVEALAQRELIIRERARELADARDEALAAVRAKDEFLANMSHEIRTPLNGIIGMTSVLLDSAQPDDQREMVKTIQRSSTALLAVLNEILDFSKLEAHAVVLEKIPFDLRECIEDAIDLLGRAAFQKGIDIYVNPDVDVPRWIEGDITYLRQVLLNLIGNAIKFTDEGEVGILVSSPTPDTLHFQVRDTGIGIAEDKHALLFQSFSQVDASTTRKYGGTGLGLAISKRLIELMGGKIWVESSEGKGSTFHFTIEAKETEAPVRPMTTHERVSVIGKSVVLLGGKPGSHGAAAELLRRWGVVVTSELDVSRTTETIEAVNPDIVILYQNALAEVLKLQDRPPTVLLVPLADAETRAHAAANIIEAVVFRPVRQRALKQALEAVISGAPLTTPGPSFTVFDPTMGERVPARILVGEDNPVNQRVAVTVLEKLGYSPDVVSNGLEALDALERRDYDILFLDLQMPGMDGLQTAREVRREHPFDHPWIVALTASVSLDQRNAAEAAGMNDFVSKPFDVQTLMVAIERWGQLTGMLSESIDMPISAPSEESPWDQLRAMFSRAPEKLAELIVAHRKNGGELVAGIEEACAARDLEQVALHAHALKSSASQFGSDSVGQISLTLEKLARAGDDVEALVEELRAEWTEADARLESVIVELRALPVPE